MSFFSEVQSETLWNELLLREEEKPILDKRLIRSIKSIINKEKYLEYNKDFFSNWPIPKFVKIPRYNTSKTRDVFIYPHKHNIVLKALAFYLLREYNYKFSSNSIAYTWGKGPKTAFNMLRSFNLKPNQLIFKNDFKDYFNAIRTDILDSKLKAFIQDNDLSDFIMSMLNNPVVEYKGKEIEMFNKGVMAGTPISGILANIYMHEVDKQMLLNNYKYIRYADDTLIVGQEALDFFTKQLSKLGIIFNQKKSETFTIDKGITFLGFKFVGKTIDLSDEAVAKMKSRMKRRARWYRVWMANKKVPKKIAIKHYIRGINEKLYTDFADSINWSQWYMPSINTVESIKYLDRYYVNCIRYLDSGTWRRGKHYYNLQYKDIKKLGYVSLVNTYYKIKKPNKAEEAEVIALSS